MKNKKMIIGWVAVLLLAGGLIYSTTLIQKKGMITADLGPFVQCLKDKGAIFYGAFWCPHCQNQKKMFGDAADKLPYIECSNPDGKSQTQMCIDQKIEGYPTWVFADGTREGGEVSLQRLAEKTSCTLPTDEVVSDVSSDETL